MLLENYDDAERLYQNFIRYQLGDKSALDEVFMETGKNICEINRIQELEEEYKLLHSENVLDAGLVENEIRQKREDQKLKVVFSFQCINIMVKRAKWYFSKKWINTGYENGKKNHNQGYKKYFEGEYDVSDLEEVMQEIVIKLFQGKLSGSNIDIVNSKSLLENIKYYFGIEVNKNNGTWCKNILETYIDPKTGEEVSYFDQYSEINWLKSRGQVSRQLLYDDCLNWLQKYDIHNLFNTSSLDIHAIIDIILEYKFVFETGELGYMQLVKQKTLKDIIYKTAGRNIEKRNISTDLKLIEQRLIDHLFYSLNYYISKAPQSSGEYDKESQRYLYRCRKQSYFKIFSRERMRLYEICCTYLKEESKNTRYLDLLQKYEDIILPILMKEKGRKKYDMVNLINENFDVIDKPLDIVLQNIVDLIVEHFNKEETEKIQGLLNKYNMTKICSSEKYRYWEAELLYQCMNIKLWSREDVKNPVRYKINREHLIVFKGYRNYYFFDCENNKCYLNARDKRIISKSDMNHKTFFYKSE